MDVQKLRSEMPKRTKKNQKGNEMKISAGQVQQVIFSKDKDPGKVFNYIFKMMGHGTA